MYRPTETEDNDEDLSLEDMLNDLEGSSDSDKECEEEEKKEGNEHAQNQNLRINTQPPRLVDEFNFAH